MNDGLSVSDVCSSIRARVNEALEARGKDKPCTLSHDDVAEDIFALRSAYLVSQKKEKCFALLFLFHVFDVCMLCFFACLYVCCAYRMLKVMLKRRE